MKVIGKDIPQINFREKVTGRAQYAGDIQRLNALHVKVLRSPYAHARIVSVDASAARDLPGVHLVLSGDDVPDIPTGVVRKEHRILARGKVRHIGEEVVAVVAESEDIARDALDLVEVEYDPLDAVFDPEEAMARFDVSVHDDRVAGDRNNVAKEFKVERGDVDAAFRDAAYVYEATYRTHPQYPGYLEPMATVAEMGPDGRLTVWLPNHSIFLARQRFAEALGMPATDIRVIQTTTGGSFGAKMVEECNSLITAFVATRTNRPVRFVNSRLEDIQGARMSLPETIRLKMGIDKDGLIVAKDARLIGDCGAYAGLSNEVLHVSLMRSDNMHRIENVRSHAVLAYTNNPPRGAFRGFGGPQMTFCVNSHLAVLARMAGIDELEIHQRNAIRTGDVSVHGWQIRSGGLPQCLDAAAGALDWTAKKKRAPDTGTRRRGLGLGSAIHVSGNRTMGNWDGSTVILKVDNSGGVTLFTGEADIGQGAYTMLAQVVAQELDIPVSKIRVPAPDTDSAPWAIGSIASRVTITGGNAALKAASLCRDAMIEVAADHFDVDPGTLELSDGFVVCATPGANQKLSYGEIARMHIWRHGGSGLQVTGSYDAPTVTPDHETLYGDVAPAYSFAAQAVEVEVDTETGQVRVLDTYLADDCGRALNPAAVHGQSCGAVVQAIGWTLYETPLIEEGMILNGSFADYTMPTTESLPDIGVGVVETIDPNGPFGAKGASETAIVPGAGAIANAVYDAIGVRIDTLPITPEKILAALADPVDPAAKGGA